MPRHLYVLLDAESREKAARHARLPIVRGDHLTLAHAAPPGATVSDYLDGVWHEGDELTLHVIAEYQNVHVQAWLVELNGSSRRKHDAGRLHVTVSRSTTARSRDSNALLQSGTPTPRTEVLRGTLRWVPAISAAEDSDMS